MKSKKSYSEYLKSPEWAKVKASFYAKHAKACSVCGVSRKLHLHHKTYRHLFHELEHLDDLVCLCAPHHAEIHDRTLRVADRPLTKSARRRRKRRERELARREERRWHHESVRIGGPRELTLAEKRREEVIAQIIEGAP